MLNKKCGYLKNQVNKLSSRLSFQLMDYLKQYCKLSIKIFHCLLTLLFLCWELFSWRKPPSLWRDILHLHPRHTERKVNQKMWNEEAWVKKWLIGFTLWSQWFWCACLSLALIFFIHKRLETDKSCNHNVQEKSF